jgi:SAM-dependent methyltransferase
VELNADTAAIARARGLEVTTGTLDRLPEEVRDFDAVTMWDVIEHVPDPVGLLRDTHARLTAGGWLWLATPNVDGIFPNASLKVADRVGRWPHPEPPYHLSQFSERTIRHALGLAGFHDVVVHHRRIPLSYTFGSPRKVLTEPKRLAYTAVFAPMALAGPWISRGDTLILAARRS